MLNGNTWQLAYTLQSGLNLGQPYTVMIWGVTSTVSKNGEQGADPNETDRR